MTLNGLKHHCVTIGQHVSFTRITALKNKKVTTLTLGSERILKNTKKKKKETQRWEIKDSISSELSINFI